MVKRDYNIVGYTPFINAVLPFTVYTYIKFNIGCNFVSSIFKASK